jgi:hypothetical protein
VIEKTIKPVDEKFYKGLRRLLIANLTLVGILLQAACANPPAERNALDLADSSLFNELGISVRPPAYKSEFLVGPNSWLNSLRFETAFLHTVDLPFDLSSHPIEILGDSFSNCFLLYHAGHGGPVQGISSLPVPEIGSPSRQELLQSTSIPLIQGALDVGCGVFVFQMPRGGYGMGQDNSNPVFARLESGVVIDLRDWSMHSAFGEMSTEDQNSALAVFLEPVLSVLTLLKKDHPTSGVGMVGLSGGGWATSVIPALTTELDFAVSVAGSDPSESLAYDFEQSHPVLADVGYRDIYRMGVENGVNFFHVYNSGDPCCFDANDKDLSLLEREVDALISPSAPGSYEIFVDPSEGGHEIRRDSLVLILELIEGIASEDSR